MTVFDLAACPVGCLHLAAINFDDQARFKTDEIDNIGLDRHLPFETETLELLVADGLSEHVLCLGRIGAHIAGELATVPRNSAALACLHLP